MCEEAARVGFVCLQEMSAEMTDAVTKAAVNQTTDDAGARW